MLSIIESDIHALSLNWQLRYLATFEEFTKLDHHHYHSLHYVVFYLWHLMLCIGYCGSIVETLK